MHSAWDLEHHNAGGLIALKIDESVANALKAKGAV